MCVDYTDLNKECPKDSYPLPSIDRLVNGASGHALLSFLDASSGYNQIMMYPPDEVHTSFIKVWASQGPMGLMGLGRPKLNFSWAIFCYSYFHMFCIHHVSIGIIYFGLVFWTT
uniref:Transposon Ty3-I Gag-Pol polyprotein n=1 Tax=Cajanus cajan TaxID=3821 RepID=A0A151T3Q4_CAJCA|nr:Transposon Ty3-I Gag-Pol polyprotein [Cajanus cajan]